MPVQESKGRILNCNVGSITHRGRIVLSGSRTGSTQALLCNTSTFPGLKVVS